MALFTVFILLALVGPAACVKKQGPSGAPSADPTPTPRPTSTPPPPQPSPATTADASRRPLARFVCRIPDIDARELQTPVRTARGRERPLLNYAVQNLARLQGRSIVHSRIIWCDDGFRQEFCICDEKLGKEAFRYREYGTLERWCDNNPEDRRELRADDDDHDDDKDNNVGEYDHLLSRQSVDSEDWFHNERESSSRYSWISSTEGIHPSLILSSPSVKRWLSSRQTQRIPAPSPSWSDPSVAFNQESESLQLRNFNGQDRTQYEHYKASSRVNRQRSSPYSRTNGTEAMRRTNFTSTSVTRSFRNRQRLIDKLVDYMLSVLPARQPSSSDSQQEGSVTAMEVDTARSLAFELASNFKIPSVYVQGGGEQVPMDEDILDESPEPQPGPSGLCRPPSSRLHNSSYPDHHGTRPSRDGSVIHYADAKGDIVGYVSYPELAPPPKEDLNKELNRIFGEQEDNNESSSKKPKVKYCLGELTVAMFGTSLRPLYTVYVECHRDPDICPPLTVCSPVVDPFTVTIRKYVPFEQQVFRLMKDPYHDWEPAKLHLPTACFCAPPDHKPRQMKIFNRFNT